MKKDFFDELLEKYGMTRRDFMKYATAAGAALALPNFLFGCADSRSSADTGERRTFYFDLSNGDPGHVYYLFARGRAYPLERIRSDEDYRRALEENPVLQLLPRERTTHVKRDLPVAADAIGLCYVMGDPGSVDGSWTMPLVFYHLPESALARAASRLSPDRVIGGLKWRFYDSQAEAEWVLNHPMAYRMEDDIKTPFDHAVALTFSHPETLAAVPDSAAYIQKNIVGAQESTKFLGMALSSQGPATETGGWATLEPLRDPDTNQTIYNKNNGKKQYHAKWSELSFQSAADAMKPSMVAVKSDPSLGANITGYAPDEDHPEISGKIWKVYEGLASTEADEAPGSVPFTYKLKRHNPDHGYHATLDKVTFDAATGNATAKITVKNWFVRYLGLFVRFIRADGSAVKLKDLPQDIQDQFPSLYQGLNSDYDAYVAMLAPEMELFSIPIKSMKKTFEVLIPDSVSSLEIMAGGLGRSGDASGGRATVIQPGVAGTAIVNLTVPTIFLASMAATSYTQWACQLNLSTEANLLIGLITDVFFGTIVDVDYGDAHAFSDVVNKVTTYLITKGGWVWSSVTAEVDEGEAINSIPIAGIIMTAAAAAILLAAIGQTIGEVCSSPKIYNHTLARTHNVTLTIHPDVRDPDFPETATHYDLTLLFDDGTPRTKRLEMPDTTVSLITYTFKNIPYGGIINVTVSFYSNTEFLVGKGTTGPVSNTSEEVAITITELEVPLTADTTYHHKEISTFDDAGGLIWTASEAPRENITDLSCENVPGELCRLGYITVSELTGSVGYSWKSYCGSPASGQFFQIANMAFTEHPEDSHLVAGFEFPGMVPIVYDLMGTTNDNFYVDPSGSKLHVRQVRLSLGGKPDFDEPGSNRSFGYFAYPSDGLVLHAARKLVSVNMASHNMEVLDITDAFTDDEAPQAHVYAMEGTREGLLKGPICVAIAKGTSILILESENRRIQAFDTSGNPIPCFNGGKDCFFPLKEEENVRYVGFTAEHAGYMYVLSYVTGSGLVEYHLDLYDPDGNPLARTTGFNAGNITVDFWRNLLALNYGKLRLSDGTPPVVTEPSVSKWIPSTPKP